MSRKQAFFWCAWVITIGVAIWMCFQRSLPMWAATVALIGVGWGASIWYRKPWGNSACFLVLVGIAAGLIAFRNPHQLPLTVAVLSLITWDLGAFLAQAEYEPRPQALRYHVQFLAGVIGVSLGLLALAQLVIIELGFWPLIGVIAMLMLTLGQFLSFVQRATREAAPTPD